MNSSQKVLVTGAAGYIGSHMSRYLEQQGWQPVGLDNFSTGFEEALLPGMPVIRAEAGDQEAVAQAIKDHDIKHVIHFAGSVINTESIDVPVLYYENNVFQTLKLFEVCAREGVENFIYSSSAGIYGDALGGAADKPLTEDVPGEPLTPYGASKWISERMISDVAASPACDTKFVCLRYFNVAGAAFGIGQRAKVSTHLIKILCEALTGKRDQMAIFGTDYPTPDGTCIRDYIHVADLAAAHLEALKYLIKGGESTMMNCGYGRGFSVREVIDSGFEVTGLSVPINEEARRPGDPASLVASNAKMLELTDWTPEFDDLREIIRSAYEWEKRIHNQKDAA